MQLISFEIDCFLRSVNTNVRMCPPHLSSLATPLLGESWSLKDISGNFYSEKVDRNEVFAPRHITILRITQILRIGKNHVWVSHFLHAS